ncbi:MAG: NADH-quinone oxidoreductase subunit NuoK [Ignavibacteriales bacterium]|nr:NADH-quinone oxidoreductase subunit NuoK [Ignavibacteriales bacterium]
MNTQDLINFLQHPGLIHFLILSGLLFSFGIFAILTRRNAIMVLMGVELVLNAANINFVAFSRYVTTSFDGHVVAIFVIILAAAEAAIALAIILNIYQNFNTVNVDEINQLKD